MIAFGLFPFPGFLAALIRSVPQESGAVGDMEIPFEARLEWARQRVYLWATLTGVGVPAAMAFLYGWLNYTMNLINVSPEGQALHVPVQGLYALQGAGLILYIAVGPWYESFVRAQNAIRQILSLRKSESESQQGNR
jgi:hypothetical protein